MEIPCAFVCSAFTTWWQEHWFDHEHQTLYDQLAAQLGYRLSAEKLRETGDFSGSFRLQNTCLGLYKFHFLHIDLSKNSWIDLNSRFTRRGGHFEGLFWVLILSGYTTLHYSAAFHYAEGNKSDIEGTTAIEYFPFCLWIYKDPQDQGECERQVLNQTASNGREGYESLQRSGWNCDGRSEDGFLGWNLCSCEGAVGFLPGVP